jgi:hypothetical protein
MATQFTTNPTADNLLDLPVEGQSIRAKSANLKVKKVGMH